MHNRSDDAATRRLPLLVRTLRGLELVAAAEARERLSLEALIIGHRELRFESPDIERALTLGVADDVFLVVLDCEPVGHVKAELDLLAERVRSIDLDAAAGVIADLRSVRGKAFDVSASFLGARNYSRFDIEDAVGAALGSSTGWQYQSRRGGRRPDTDLSLRVHLTGEGTTVAVRLAASPLHRRSYRLVSRPGALHPPLARALVLLCEPQPDASVLDPFCGTGTIAIEAKLWSPSLTVTGSDFDASAVDAARRNAAAAAVFAEFEVADAASLAAPRRSLDCIVTNPPWGVRVQARGELARRLALFWSEADRVLRSDGRLSVLAPRGAVVGLPGGAFEAVNRCEVRVSGALAEVVVLCRR